MENYFEGKIKFKCESDKNYSFEEIIYLKYNYCRFDTIYKDSKSTSIDTPNKVYYINYDEKTIVDCGNDNRNKANQKIQIIELKEKATILNHQCSVFKIEGKIEFEGETEIIDEKHYINNTFQVYPSVKSSSTIFKTSHIPLKIIRKTTLDHLNITFISTAIEINRIHLNQVLFSPNCFKGFELISVKENEKRWEDKTKIDQEKREKERATAKKEMEEHSNVMALKLITFLEIEFKRKLTESEKQNPHQYLLSTFGKVTDKEGLILSKKFLKYL